MFNLPLSGTLLILFLLIPGADSLAEPGFDSPPEHDSAGFFTLDWSGADRFELEQATGPDHADARIIYRGSDTSTTISGLSDNSYRFRVRAEGAATWSDEAVVVVEHHALSRAFLFFALGAAVFGVLLLAIARGRKLA
ncbi:MAG: fibronectin type III domain-containing protein [Thioalkalivibrio sp.]|nr:fibronectin type III domain-containing protein [Thioalkalivibrio sp.]